MAQNHRTNQEPTFRSFLTKLKLTVPLSSLDYIPVSSPRIQRTTATYNSLEHHLSQEDIQDSGACHQHIDDTLALPFRQPHLAFQYIFG